MSPTHRYRGRRAATIENRYLRVTVLQEGGHIAEVFDKRAHTNPLWTPPWPTIEHSTYERGSDAVYGGGVEASLLAGIMGHNLCLDIFGGPSAEEAAAGLPVHGEASAVTYDIEAAHTALVLRAHLALAQLDIERRLELRDNTVRVRERVENPTGIDRAVGWTQHVTLGPPFLVKGETQFRASATMSKVIGTPFGSADYLETGAEFDWPMAPRRGGGLVDLREFTDLAVSSAYTAHLMDTARDTAFFAAFSPAARLTFGYIWRPAEFPWLGIWEENSSRTHPPWNGATLTRGMEFGVSPFPESRREMIERGRMFGIPTFRWVPARSSHTVEYWVVSRSEDRIPDTLDWPA
jgi:hypothetical protein